MQSKGVVRLSKDTLGKPAVDLVPPDAILEIGMAMADGRIKYGQWNYLENPSSWSEYIGAGMRHFTKFACGEDLASDSRIHHMGHAAACACILFAYSKHGIGLDDRYGTVINDNRRAARKVTESM